MICIFCEEREVEKEAPLPECCLRCLGRLRKLDSFRQVPGTREEVTSLRRRARGLNGHFREGDFSKYDEWRSLAKERGEV